MLIVKVNSGCLWEVGEERDSPGVGAAVSFLNLCDGGTGIDLIIC